MIRRPVVIVAIALGFAAAPAAAGPGIDLSVHGCPGNPGATGGYASLSDDVVGSGPQVDCAGGELIALIGTWSPAEAIPDLAALDGTFEVWVRDGLDANPFWNFEPSGCNEVGFNTSHVRPSGCSSPAYRNTWGTASAGSAWSFQRTSADRARLYFVVYRPDGIAVAQDELMFGMQILIAGESAIEAGGVCSGCCAKADFLWGSAFPRTLSGAPTTELNASTGRYPGFSNGIEVSGNAASCSPVPTRPRTWGALKSLYR